MPPGTPTASPTSEPALDTAISYGWKSAYGFLVATLASYALGAMFFIEGGVYAPLSDASALLVGVLMAPLVWVLYLLSRDHDGSRAVMWLGFGSVAFASLGALGLLIGDLFALGAIAGVFLGLQFLGIILEGLWLLTVGLLGTRSGAFPRGVSLAALAAGLGYAGGIITLSATYALSLPVDNPAFLLVAALAFGGIVTWSLLLAGDLRSRERQARSAAGGRPRRAGH